MNSNNVEIVAERKGDCLSLAELDELRLGAILFFLHRSQVDEGSIAGCGSSTAVCQVARGNGAVSPTDILMLHTELHSSFLGVANDILAANRC